MNTTATVLCPIDFSDAGRGALRYARAIVEHFGGRLIILTVEDPLLTEAIDLGTGIVWDPEVTRKELVDFSAAVFGDRLPRGADIALEVAVGKPAEEILRMARKERCDLIVMSTHGLTGARKFFFGSTTERVLRDTTVPVLATPATDKGPDDLDQARRIVGRILVPVDLTSRIVAPGPDRERPGPGAGCTARFSRHVVEPVRSPLAAKLHLHSIELERRARAEDLLRGVDCHRAAASSSRGAGRCTVILRKRSRKSQPIAMLGSSLSACTVRRCLGRAWVPLHTECCV